MTKTPPPSARLNLVLAQDVLTQIDELRRREPDLPNRTVMLRRLLGEAIAAREAGRRGGRKGAG